MEKNVFGIGCGPSKFEHLPKWVVPWKILDSVVQTLIFDLCKLYYYINMFYDIDQMVGYFVIKYIEISITFMGDVDLKINKNNNNSNNNRFIDIRLKL